MDRADSHRLQWTDLPTHVRRRIEGVLGGAVTHAAGQRGGYGPGLATRVTIADGRRFFVKAVSPAQNPDSPQMMRTEALMNSVLPDEAPAPRLLEVLDDGEWIALVFEDLEGSTPGEPWTEDDLCRVAALNNRIGQLEIRGLPGIAERYGEMFTGWRTLSQLESRRLDRWSETHLSDLAELESRWAEVASGTAVVHGDFRSDNILLTESDAFAVDWTSPCIGTGLFDILGMLPSVALAGGGAPEDVLAAMGHTGADREFVPLVAAFAGYFVERSHQPDPPGLPTVRQFQRDQGAVVLAWLRRLTGWS